MNTLTQPAWRVPSAAFVVLLALGAVKAVFDPVACSTTGDVVTVLLFAGWLIVPAAGAGTLWDARAWRAPRWFLYSVQVAVVAVAVAIVIADVYFSSGDSNSGGLMIVPAPIMSAVVVGLPAGLWTLVRHREWEDLDE